MKEEYRIRAMAKLGYHMQKDINYVKTAIYQSCTDVSFSKDSIDLIVTEVFGTPIDIIDGEIKSALGHINSADNSEIESALTKLGRKASLVN